MEKISEHKKQLIIQFHTVLNKNGLMKQKPAMLESFGVKSSKDLAEEELEVLISQMKGEASTWRKRVIAAIFGWCKTLNLEYDTETVKRIACRASGYKNFNKIPVSRLRDLYYEWVKKNRITVGSQAAKQEIENYLECRN